MADALPATGGSPPGGPISGGQPNGTPTGSIYDLGYRHYDGPRLGRRYALTSLVTYTLRTTYGIGRGGRAKIVPFGLAALVVIPAVIAVAILAVARQAGDAGQLLEESSPLRYDSLYGAIAQIVFLFCAAQAPELLGKDQRYHVLSLYFSRALARSDYVVARVGGFAIAILLLVLVPQLIVFVGRILSAPDVVAEIGKNLPVVPAIVGQGLLTAGLLGAIAVTISAFTPRRAYATAGIIAVVVVPPIIAQLADQIARHDLARWAVLASAQDVLSATNAWLFDVQPDSDAVRSAGLPPEVYVGTAIAVILVLGAILLRRYQRIAA
jgi:ABC-2 type transport system permease protein